MIIETPRLPENNTSSGSGIILVLLALAVTGGILYWQFKEKENQIHNIRL